MAGPKKPDDKILDRSSEELTHVRGGVEELMREAEMPVVRGARPRHTPEGTEIAIQRPNLPVGPQGTTDLADELTDFSDELDEDDGLPDDLGLDDDLPPEDDSRAIEEALALPGRTELAVPIFTRAKGQFADGGTEIVPSLPPRHDAVLEPARADQPVYIASGRSIAPSHRGAQDALTPIRNEVLDAFQAVLNSPPLSELPPEIASRLKPGTPFELVPFNRDGSPRTDKSPLSLFILNPESSDDVKVISSNARFGATLLPKVGSPFGFSKGPKIKPEHFGVANNTSRIIGIHHLNGHIILVTQNKSGDETIYRFLINDGQESPTGFVGVRDEKIRYEKDPDQKKAELLEALKLPGARFRLIKLNSDGTPHGKVILGTTMEDNEVNHSKVKERYPDFIPSASPEAGKRFYYLSAKDSKILMNADYIDTVEGYRDGGVLVTLQGGKRYLIKLNHE